MVARRTSSRRRRVLNEEMVRTEEVVVDESEAKRKSKQLAYSSGANRRNQLKTTDLLPKRWFSFTSVIVLLLLSIVGINALAYFSPQWQTYIGFDNARSLSFDGRGSLSSWFISFLLMLSSVASLQIYALRQHRRDDYQGSYRVWTWMAVLFFIASVDTSIGLRSIFCSLFESVSHRAIVPHSLAAIFIPMMVLSAISIRMLFEVRDSRLTIAAVVCVWLTYCSSMVLETPWAQSELANLNVAFNESFIIGNCMLCAAVGIVVSHLIYARFVYLHAHGLIEVAQVEVKEKKNKTKKKASRSVTRRSAKNSSTDETNSGQSTGEENSTAEITENSVEVKSTKSVSKKGSATRTTAETSKPKIAASTTSKTKKKKATSKATSTSAGRESDAEGSKSDNLSSLLSKFSGSANGGGKAESTPKSKMASKSKTSTVSEPSAEDTEDEPNILKLSKSERRRRRKEEKRNRRKAA